MRNYRDMTVTEMIQRNTPEIVDQYLPFTQWTLAYPPTRYCSRSKISILILPSVEERNTFLN